MRRRTLLCAALACFLAIGAAVCAQVPELINYQGRLVDGGGLVNATTSLVFKIYNTETNGTPLYEETQTVTIVDGLYSTCIGLSNATGGALSSTLTNDAIYLELVVGTSSMAPRERITAVAYSLLTDGVKAGGLTSEMLADNAVTSSKLAEGSVSSNALASSAVNSIHIADGAITSSDIADDAVGSSELAKKYESGSVNFGTIVPALEARTLNTNLTVSFSTPFSVTPIVVMTIDSPSPEVHRETAVYLLSRSPVQFTAQLSLPLSVGQVDTNGSVGAYTSLAEVNGRPAISYYGGSGGGLKYVRAHDDGSSSWASPITIDTNGNAGTHTSLEVVNGQPAISYYSSSPAPILKYVRANDADGDSWGSPVTITNAQGQATSLAVVNGRPAISFRLSPNLRYVRANDADGTSWGTLVSADTNFANGYDSSLTVINGRPAISYYADAAADLKYVRADDADGNTWGTPIAIDTNGVTGRYGSLAVVNGRPAISYQGTTGLDYVRANDTNGVSWALPIPVDTGVVKYTSLSIVGGQPAIAYYDSDNKNLKYVQANDVDGLSWGVPRIVDSSTNDVGQYASLSIVNGSPAISYSDQTSGDLKYVPALIPTNSVINWIAAEP